MGLCSRVSQETPEKPRELDPGGNGRQLWPWEGRAARSRHQAGPHDQGGWWLWTNKVVTWNAAGWASLSHFLPVPTVSLSHLQEVAVVRWRVRSPGSSLGLAVASLCDPQSAISLARTQLHPLSHQRPA